MYLICYLLGIVFFFNLEPRVISAHFQRCRNDPGLEITNLFVFFSVKKSQSPSRLSYNSLLKRSIVNPCMDQSLIAIYFGEPLSPNFALNHNKKKKGKKKEKEQRLVQQTLSSVVTHSWTTNITNKDGFAPQTFDFCQSF